MKSLILLLIFFLACNSYSTGQNADSIIEKYFTAIGGYEKIISVQTFVSKGKQVFDGTVSSVTTIIDEGKLWRQDTKINGKKEFYLITQKGAWQYSNHLLKKLDDSLSSKEKSVYFLESALYEYGKPGFNATFIGNDTADGKACYKIRAWENLNESLLCWFDTATNLLIKTSVKTSIGVWQKDGSIKDVPVFKNTIYRDYKNTDGLLYAFTYLNKGISLETGSIVRTINFYASQIKINRPVNERYYKPE